MGFAKSMCRRWPPAIGRPRSANETIGKIDGLLVTLARELVGIPVDVIVTLAPPATVAARNATQTIPIVFVAIAEPVASGLVASLARPGANLTGTTRMLPEMSAKHVDLRKRCKRPRYLKRIAEFAASTRLPAIANFIEFPKLGGLMGYAPSIPDEFRHAAVNVTTHGPGVLFLY
jgi:hypothetical protein